MGEEEVDVRERVRCLNVSVTPSDDAVNRLVNDCIFTPITLRVV